MAISQNPLTGQMSGTVGNFVTSSLGSKNIVRTKAFSRRDDNSNAQQMQRGGFKMIGELYPSLGSIPEEGFAQRPANTTVYNAFISANLPEAIDKTGDTASIDYSKLTVANGNLTKVIVIEATLEETGITIKYAPSLKNEQNKSTDNVVALALLASGDLWIERQPRGEEATASILIPVTNVSATNILGIYIFAKRADGSKVSKSCYVPLNE